MKVDLKSYDNSWFNPGGSAFKRILWYFTNAIFFTNHLIPVSSVKVALLRLFGAEIGTGVVIKPSVNIKYPWNLKIGEYSWIGENVWIDNLAMVSIGANCCISQGAMLLCGNHNYKKSTFDLIVKPITISEGAWIGAKSVVCPGVTIGENTVLTVGSIVTKSVSPNLILSPNNSLKQRI